MNRQLELLPAERKIGVAVSGGGDSVALLRLLVQQFGNDRIVVLHFDHALRAESAQEAEWVVALSQRLGVEYVVKRWDLPVVDGNVQQAARCARYQFFAEEIERQKLDFVCTGHTQNDVAETLFMRLLRGSGVTGLASMAVDNFIENAHVVRPLLSWSRDDLRQYLQDLGQDWLEDPSNDNEKFFRVRVRKAIAGLAERSNIDAALHMAAAARSLRRADDALEYFTDLTIKECFQEIGSNILMYRNIFNQPEEIQLRLVARAICRITGAGLAPRSSKRANLLQMMKEGQLPATLGGVKVVEYKKGFLFSAENAQKEPQNLAENGSDA